MTDLAEKKEFNEHLQKVFVLQDSLKEPDIKRKHPKLYEQAYDLYGSWKKALRENGIKKRKMTEREKFYLYHIMKRRYEKYGEEALRPKNIEPEMKERIVDVYKTLKNLRNLIIGWNEEKVLFEVRKLLVCGKNVQDIQKIDPTLYKHMNQLFDDVEDMKEEYDNFFSVIEIPDIPTAEKVVPEKKPELQVIETKKEEVREPKVSKEEPKKPKDLKDVETYVFQMLQDIHYYENDEVAKVVQKVIEGSHVPKKDVMDYLLKKMSEARKQGKMLTEEALKEDNAAMYHGFKKHFKSLREAFEEMTKSLIG